MGGDKAPDVVIDGTALAVSRNPLIVPTLVGDEHVLRPLLSRHSSLKNVEILHTPDQVEAEDVPSIALRTGKNSSMNLAISLVKEGKADAVVSAGNSGALLIMALMALRTMEGIDRPALAAYMPTIHGLCCMLDLGANIDCNAEHLVQFAIMGDAFCRVTTGVQTPSLGLLNVGEEEQKGNATIREAATVLSRPDVALNYIGFVEGNDITSGEVDVVVSDGFSGNIALKTTEGTAQFITTLLRRSFKSSAMAKLGYLLARPALKGLRKKLDPQLYNGAVLLGLNGIVVKSHGGANARGIANAIEVATRMIENDFLNDLKQSVERSMLALDESSAQ
ncbi:MAG: phosphate acyltransferase PlsX [Alphaproteobacteria bacterium]|nr:phosphate acyltransferase PlsX [Alphaproteobacteria bacterium]